MQIVHDGTAVIATHGDNQDITGLYPGLQIWTIPDGTALERIGDPAPGDGPDTRPFAVPVLTGDLLVAAVKSECRRRIYDVADEIAQVNLNANRASGLMPQNDRYVYSDGVEWIAAMRVTCSELIAAGDTTYADDSHWPVPDADVVELAARY